MNRLSELQDGFIAAQGDPELARQLFGASARGLSAYANNTLFNRADALAEAFPIVRRLVGDDFFGAMARAFARGTPSTSGDLNRYGATFPDFIAGFAPAADLPYLADAARLDWLVHLAYYAADAGPFDFAALAAVDPAQQAELVFIPHPASALLTSPWPIASLWLAHQGGEFPAQDQGGETALVWRDHHPSVRPLAPAEAAFVTALYDGEPLGLAIEAAFAQDETFELGVSLNRLIADQVFITIR
ncbi:HvfC/BufC family peptide modification chaperone [Chitinimonas lacunae]|uniref:DNA-binding domain-containing protein n=1 Tax=Chitinimonas lacunae TaxID=1963018 RepID=A0ABV8MT24_9NEIS